MILPGGSEDELRLLAEFSSACCGTKIPHFLDGACNACHSQLLKGHSYSLAHGSLSPSSQQTTASSILLPRIPSDLLFYATCLCLSFCLISLTDSSANFFLRIHDYIEPIQITQDALRRFHWTIIAFQCCFSFARQHHESATL